MGVRVTTGALQKAQLMVIELKEERFKKVLSKWDTIALAFGAMIGWGWVVMSGTWIETAGTLGAVLAFTVGGVMIIFVGLIYAELTSALPECGGEHVFSKRALGRKWSYACTWALILGYFGVAAFEACALPSVFTYLVPQINTGYMYSVAGCDVYLTYIFIGSGSAIIITLINYVGVKPTSVLQSIMTLAIIFVGLLLCVSTSIEGDISNIEPLFNNGISGFLTIAVMTPFSLMGFDVIPQAAEELNIPPRKISKIIILSVIMGVAFYSIVIFSVSLMMTHEQIRVSELVTADALNMALKTERLGSCILIIGGIAGIVSSWNAFILGGSRCIFAMAESGMLPRFLTKIHPRYQTPSNAVLLIGLLSAVSPFFGKAMLVWLSNAGSFAITLAYFIVVLSFIALRLKEPNLYRPYKIKNVRFVAVTALIMTFIMLLLYMPGMPSGMSAYEWLIVGLWAILGIILQLVKKAGKSKIS